MVKITPLSDLDNLDNPSSVVSTINTNMDRIETALQNTLSLDGSAPNSMGADLDMNSNQIINLGAPSGDNDAVRKIDLDTLEAAVDQSALDQAVADAEAAQLAAEAAQEAAEVAQAATEGLLDNFDDIYLGSHATDPTVDNDGDPLVEGQLYWDSANGALNVYDGSAWQSYSADTGDVTGPASSVDGEIALFDNTSGKLIKRATTTGLLKAASGVLSQAVAGTDYYNPGGTDVAIADGGTGASDAATAFGNLKQAATTSATGVVELATDAETVTGTDTARAVTPSNLTGARIYGAFPVNSKSAAYTTVLADANGIILHPAADNNARTFTIDSNANVAYPIGTALMFINEINTVTISITSDTLAWAGSTSTGSRTLGANGVATAVKITSTKWYISGSGLT